MIIWNTIVSTLGFASDLNTRLHKLCSPDLKQLNKNRVEEFAISIGSNKGNLKRALTDFYSRLTSGRRISSSAKLKFILLMFHLQKHPVVREWIISHKLSLQLEKGSLMQSVSQQDMLELYTKEVCNRLEYYLVRKVRSVQGGDRQNQQPESVLLDLSQLYKCANDLDYLCELKELFHRLFSHYSEISLIEESFSLTLVEANKLYEEFKGSFGGYFSRLDQENLQIRYSEICEVLETNRKAHRRLRQFYCTADVLAGERSGSSSHLQLSRLAEPPPYLQKWLAHTRRLNKLTINGDLTKSTVLLNSSSVAPRRPLQSVVLDRDSDRPSSEESL